MLRNFLLRNAQMLLQGGLLILLLTGSAVLAQFSEPMTPAPLQSTSVDIIDSSTIRQVKGGTDPDGEIKVRSLFLDNALCFDSEDPKTCAATWSGGVTPRCRIETARVAARNKSVYDAVGLGPAFSPNPTPGSITCNDVLSAQSKSDGWIATNIDHYNRVQSSDPAPPKICQFSRLVCEGVTVTSPVANDYPVYPTPGLTKSSNQCSDGKNNEASFTKLSDANIVGGFPAQNAFGAAFSIDTALNTSYLAVAHGGGSFVSIYKRSGDTFAKLTPTANPTGTGRRVAFSPNGVWLAVSQDVAPYLTIYKRSGDTFTKQPNVVSPPTFQTRGISFSPDSNFLAIVQINVAPYLHIYERSGDTFTKLTDATGPNVQPSGSSLGVDFSPDGNYLAVGHDGGPTVTIYKRTGNVFTKLSDPYPPPVASTGSRGVSFSPDGYSLFVSSINSESLVRYIRSGDIFTKSWVSNDGSGGTSVAISPNQRHLIKSSVNSGINFMEDADGAYEDAVEPLTLPSSSFTQTAFSSDGTYLAIPHQQSNYLQIYKYSGDGVDYPADPECSSWSDNSEST